MKWSAWIRIVVFLMLAFFLPGAAGFSRSFTFGTFYLTVLFWGVAWIILGISKRESRSRLIKALVRILFWLPIGYIVMIILYQLFFVKPNG
jgi:hypothetical protein